MSYNNKEKEIPRFGGLSLSSNRSYHVHPRVSPISDGLYASIPESDDDDLSSLGDGQEGGYIPSYDEDDVAPRMIRGKTFHHGDGEAMATSRSSFVYI